MTRFSVILGAAMLGLIGTASPAIATTTVETGSYSSGDDVSGNGNLSLGPGKYLISLSFTGPVSDLYGQVQKTISTNEYCDQGEGEFYCGGDDVDIIPLFDFVNPQLYQLTMTVNGPSTVFYPPGSIVTRDENSESCCSYAFNFTGLGSGSYTLSFAAIPEPSTWAMMLIGFGAIGFAARRRNQRAVLTTA